MKTPALCLAAAVLALAATARATVTESFTHTYPLTANGSIHLDNVNGDIRIIAWDKPEVSLVAEKHAKDDAELKRVEIIIETAPTRLSIKTKVAKKSGGNDHSSVHYKLMAPAGATLDKINSVNSEITVSGIQGPVKLVNVNGRITATGLRSDARLETVNGNLRASFDSLENAHEVKLDSVNGQVEVALPANANAQLRTNTVNGRCRIEQPIKLSKSGNHQLTGEIGSGAGPTVAVETVNGGIEISVSKPEAVR